jgi:hypothetical protein
MSTASHPTIDLTGLIDLHIHTAPDMRPRFADDVDTVRSAAEAGLRAVLIKSHVALTADRATIAEKVVGGPRVFGGLALNEPAGGLNPAAVRVALAMGAREIWMPTIDAANHRRMHGNGGGITLFGEDGVLRPVVFEILDIVQKADAILATGHISVEESVALVRAARERGHHRILVTHPEAHFVRMPVSIQLQIAGDGVFFERNYVDVFLSPGEVTIAHLAERIRQVGVESTVIATDFGQVHNPSPVDGLRAYLAALLSEGFAWPDLRRMAGENPAHLLGI